MAEPAFRDTEARWQAVSRRDPSASGAFVYAVRTTGVYCRPACPSRRPKRENVEFFASAAEAERAGFRACKRCTPDRDSVHERQVAAVREACRIIETAAQPPSLQALADSVGLSRFHLHRLFKQAVGITPREYAATHRVNRLQEGLANGTSVTDAIYGAGFGSSSRVYENSDHTLGMTPSAFRAGAAGLDVRFTITACPLGWLLVAATAKGICTIQFGDDPKALREHAQARFKHAALEEGDAVLESWVSEIVRYIEAPGPGLSLPLDIRGTAFQRRVWKALQAIPVGATASYCEVADAIGSPSAARAVARACASNPLAVAVPCHRVVRSDGALSGYRWGVERKRWLLDKENEVTDRKPG